MLDTRKIKEFLNPQLIINKVNAFSQEKNIYFSDWKKTDKNFVVTRLLEEHIAMVCAKEETRSKLIETARKVGYPTDTKYLILSDEFNPGFYLVEPITDSHILFAFGYFDGQLKVSSSLIIELMPEGEGKPFKFSKNTIDRDVFDRRMEFITPGQDPRMSYLFICLGAANILTYLLFVEVETVEVPPRKKFPAKRYEGFINKQDQTILVADLTWNREMLESIPFGVSGHFRVQPYGEGRAKWRLIYISPYYKDGYRKKSGKEKVLGKK